MAPSGEDAVEIKQAAASAIPSDMLEDPLEEAEMPIPDGSTMIPFAIPSASPSPPSSIYRVTE